ncbi:hypothetical protein MYSE111917_13325 [Mycobacterium senriense]
MDEIHQMTNVVGLEDLTVPEVVAFDALLAPAHTRVTRGRDATVDRDELIYSVKTAMSARSPETLTDEELRAIGAVIRAADSRVHVVGNVINFAARRRNGRPR